MISVPEHRHHLTTVILISAGLGLACALFGVSVLALQIVDWMSTGHWRSVQLIDALFNAAD
jgi:hypothetical protein